MKEEFLHYLWKYRLYYKDKLVDSTGKKIVVLHPGDYNRDSGPDFFNSRITIDGVKWAGNVEIHTKASHFNTHGHDNDPAYNNVILHVVADNDKRVFNQRGDELLTIEIEFDHLLYNRYNDLINNPHIIACQDDIGSVNDNVIHTWFDLLINERLKSKSTLINNILSETGNDWEETFYRCLARHFGFRVNTEPFEMLAAALPFRIIRKHADNRFQIETLLFGTAGMLEEGLYKEAIDDIYYSRLIREFRILSAKYNLKPIHGWCWKFSRLRPANFPTVRISQLAAMLAVTGGLFSRLLETEEVNEMMGLFDVNASDYWNNHFIFGKKTRETVKKTGSLAKNILILNAVIPVLYVYGMNRGRRDLCRRVIGFLKEMRPEENKITSEWRKIGLVAKSAFHSQAMIHLRNNYCNRRRCLDCRIGSLLISMGKRLKDQQELMLEP